MPLEHDRGRPGEERPQMSIDPDMLIVPPAACPCGCLAGVDCITELPAPDRDAHCCGPWGIDQLARGLGCPRHARRSA